MFLSYSRGDSLPFKFVLILFCCLNSVGAQAIANPHYDVSNSEHLETQIGYAKNKLNQVKEAVWAYYADNISWPSSLTLIQTGGDPFYSGTFDTPFGAINGNPAGDQYVFTLSLGASANSSKISQVRRLAAEMGGDFLASSNSAVITVTPPQSASLVSNMLSRVSDSGGQGLNEMQVNLEMSNFNIDDIASLFGVDADVAATTKTHSAEFLSAITPSISTELADIQKLNATSILGTNGSGDSFEVFGAFITTDGSSNRLASKAINATEVLATEGSIKSAGITELQGKRMDFRVGLVTNQLTTNDLVVDGEAFSPTIAIPYFSSRDASAISFLDAIKVVGASNTNSTTISNSIDQVGSAKSVFKQAVHSETLNVVGLASVGRLVTDSTLNANGFAVFGGGLQIADQTILEGAAYVDSLNVSTNFKSVQLNSYAHVKANSGLYVGGKRLSSNDGASLYINGQKLVDNFLLRGAKASNSNRLDGKSLNAFAQVDTTNTFARTQTFQNTTFNGAIRVGGHLIANNGVLYERGAALSSVYEQKNNVNSQKSNRLAQIESLKDQYVSDVNRLKDYASRIASLESLNRTNKSRSTTAKTYANNVKNYTLDTRNKASGEKSLATSLVNNVSNEYNRKRIYQTNTISKTYSNSNDVVIVAPVKECRYGDSPRNYAHYFWNMDSGPVSEPWDLVDWWWDGTYLGNSPFLILQKTGYKYTLGVQVGAANGNGKAGSARHKICREKA